LFIDVLLITQHDKKVSGLKFEVVKTRNPKPATRNQQPETKNLKLSF